MSLSALRSNTDAKALEEMLWGPKRQLQHWGKAPGLIVISSVMEYRTGDATNYTATSDQITDQEVDELVNDLTGALGTLTVSRFERFERIDRETAVSGTAVRMSRPGQIVVGRFRGMQNLAHTIGFGGRSVRADGTITAGALLLDDDYDRQSPLRRLLRTHELGHALGYNHVTTRASIMNPSIGPEPNEFDREAALVAFSGRR